MSFSAYSLTPSANVSIGGVNIAEGCPPGNVNNAIRQLAADGKELSDEVAAIDLSTYAGLASPAFTGQPTVATKGAMIFHNNSANVSGRIIIQAAGGAAPTMANGDFLFEY